MSFTPQTKIGDVVLRKPEAMRVFERLNLDYCCGGHRTMSEVCSKEGLDAVQVIAELEALSDSPQGSNDPEVWASARLTDLIAHIEVRHHTFTREELHRVAPLMEKVLRVHGGHHPELAEISSLFENLMADLLPHLQKEEQILFPYIRNLEEGKGSEACFGSVQGPIAAMQDEHEQAGEILRRLKTLTDDYTAPQDACGSYRSLYMGLQALEVDLHLHIYLESHLLFPRAVELEQGKPALG